MGAGEFLQRLQPLKAEMEAAFFRVYQPFHVQEETFDALLAMLDEQMHNRSSLHRELDRGRAWFSAAPAGMRLNYSAVPSAVQISMRAKELRELGIGWVQLSEVPFPHTQNSRQLLQTLIDAWHAEGFAVGVDFDVSGTAADDPWARQALKGDPAM